MTQQTLNPELKARHRAMWALGDYTTVANQVIPDAGQRVVDAVEVKPGERVLDVAAGSGNAAVPAALAGGRVVATDLTPELLEVGRRQNRSEDLDLEWQTADAEDLPFDDGAFDVAVSCVGIMFAPHHQRAADELVRVVRPGGRIGLLSWTPEGFIGQMFAAMKPFAPTPAPGTQPAPLWGSEDHVRGLLGDRVHDLTMVREHVVVDRFRRPEEFRDFFKSYYGPTIAVYRSLADQPERAAELDQVLVDLARRHDWGDGSMGWEYLLLTARRS